MATSVNFERFICPAGESITFVPQVGVYIDHSVTGNTSHIDLMKVTTANVSLVDGALSANFYLTDEFFTVPEDIAIASVIAQGVPKSEMHHELFRITGIIIERTSAPRLS
jgi:hypothetical protein